MGRPAAGSRASDATGRSQRRITTSLRLEPELHRRVEDEAERREVSVNWLIVRCIERTLSTYEGQALDG